MWGLLDPIMSKEAVIPRTTLMSSMTGQKGE